MAVVHEGLYQGFFFPSSPMKNGEICCYYVDSLASEVSPQYGGGSKTLYCCTCLYVVYICVCHTFIIRGCTEDFTDLTKKGNDRLRKQAIDTLDLSMMKKMAANMKAKGKKLDLHTACLVAVWERMLEFYPV